MSDNRLFMKWPYFPAEPLRATLPSFTPPGFLVLSQAIEELGRARMGLAWTGAELSARESCPKFPNSGEPLCVEDPIEKSFPSLRSASEVRVLTSFGISSVRSVEEAKKIWLESRP